MIRMFQLESLLLMVPAAASKGIQAFVMAVVVALIGASAHAIMTVIPPFPTDLWSLGNFGISCGIVFLALGAGRFVLNRSPRGLEAESQSVASSSITTGIPLVAGAAIPQLITPPPPRTVATGG
jgi:hypothetical protein